ncbi:MAG: hypothetical protein JSV25_16125 [Spirochaetota bacterium]|nr:MAG: hypothetical protein JSV25_16125 [Spirochaetota bacterium]
MCHSQNYCGCRGHGHHHTAGPTYHPLWFFHCNAKPPTRETQINFYEKWLESLRVYEKEIEGYITELKKKE